jgi:TPP-dependent pyruvate/acetoin dehydrogenase alpha subunit
VHVIDVTQPQGHSTSGSHERYKSAERLKWEEEFDGLKKMREWMTDNRVISAPELDSLEKADYDTVEGFRKAAWDAYLSPITDERNQVMDMLDEIAGSSNHASELRMIQRSAGKPPVVYEA